MSSATNPATLEGAPAELRPPGTRAAVLRCAGCGSREPVRPPARLYGWQRCGHCGLVIVAPWSDWEAYDGPSARTVVLEQPGRSHFMVPRRTLLTSLELAAWLFIVNTIAAFGVACFELGLTAGSVWRWLGPLLCVLAAIVVSALFVRLWSTVQHVEVNPRRLRRYRSVGRRRYRVLDRPLAGAVEVEAVDGIETVSENRFTVHLRDAETGATLASLILPTRREAEWIAVLMRRAVRGDGGTDVQRCSGCGAPLQVDLEARAAGSAECSFCGAGFVVGAREVRWAPLVVPAVSDLATELARARRRRAPPSRYVRRSRGRGRERNVRSWMILPDRRWLRLFPALGLTLNVLFFAAMGAGGVWISRHTPPGAVGTSLLILLGAAMMFGVAGYALLLVLILLFGREEVGMDDASLWKRSLLAGIDLTRFTAVPIRGGQRGSPFLSVPLLRLIAVETWREDGHGWLRFETPTRRLEVAWQIPADEDRRVRGEITELVAERVRALGRDVVVRPQTPTGS